MKPKKKLQKLIAKAEWIVDYGCSNKTVYSFSKEELEELLSVSASCYVNIPIQIEI